MKSIFLLLTIALTLSSPAYAQLEANMLNCDMFRSIHFNGVSIQQLHNTSGDPEQIQQLLGDADEVGGLSPFDSREFNFGANVLVYSYLHNEMVILRVKEPSWNINVAGKTIYIGMSLTQLEELLGNGNVFESLITHNVQSHDTTKKVIHIRCSLVGAEVFVIEIDTSSMIINTIRYNIHN